MVDTKAPSVGAPWLYHGKTGKAIFRHLRPEDVAWIIDKWCDSTTVIPLDAGQRMETCAIADLNGFVAHYFRGGIIALTFDEDIGELRAPRRTPTEGTTSYHFEAGESFGKPDLAGLTVVGQA